MYSFKNLTFKQRKELRTKNYFQNIHGWKLRNCSACNGSGIYDNNGTPPCAACDGTGKERYKPGVSNE